jgi:hypothetical protein
MEKFNRAVRRHHIARLKKARRLYWGFHRVDKYTGVMTPAQLGMVVQYPQTCSCLGCGNQRQYVGPKRCELADIATLNEGIW